MRKVNKNYDYVQSPCKRELEKKKKEEVGKFGKEFPWSYVKVNIIPNNSQYQL